jgi:hypothetical protein
MPIAWRKTPLFLNAFDLSGDCAVELKDVYPPSGKSRDLYCDTCEDYLDLTYKTFDEDVSGVHVKIEGLPVLRCIACGKDHLPDLSRYAIIRLHEQATEISGLSVNSARKPPGTKFSFTDVPFDYDYDDYRYIPGLWRDFDQGFLTPVFFNPRVLLKYDSAPDYQVKYASPTYGTIYHNSFYISFGINRHGKIIMWLGDVAGLPKPEQYYLKSENVPSDHSLGSQFYEGQIDCIYTEPSREDALFAGRSAFVNICAAKLGTKIAHLDEEVLALAGAFNPPVIDTEKERRHVADTLNKIYVESFDNNALGKALSAAGGDPAKLGTLKRLQFLLEKIVPTADVAKLMSPLFVLYDLRVMYSHLASSERSDQIMTKVTERLGIDSKAGLKDIYAKLVEELTAAFAAFTAAIAALPALGTPAKAAPSGASGT